MFEKDLYALIRGVRNHKGNEKGYIQDSIRECRKEIQSQDMDQKATALLKLIYLEMFGHDMSWASFNVLEVMSSAKYPHKRVGYLAAIQSFRPDTEVLMLAENLLKKDLGSMSHPTVSLTLATIPHVINASMANSLLIDLLPRLTHNVPAIRKKTVVTLYRLALVYPETLRLAWPKIKERLLDEEENTSVTAAIVNVVCELGWRRPHDFLPLAPRLFDLLVAGGNNWMAIKIIKLFAVLTPLEPRLIRKLLSPLTNLIRTTPAMSLLYECINGIILGGILDGAEGTIEGDEIARLCVGKLRGMLVVVGDPNLKYVALLALTKIVNSHPGMVSEHYDDILECIDDPDISIRSRVLDLISGMVNTNNLVPIVEQLMLQLRDSRRPVTSAEEDRLTHQGVVPSAESDEEDAAESLRKPEDRSIPALPLPDDYRAQVISKIMQLCSRDTYANISDFEWYVGILVELVRHCPEVSKTTLSENDDVANAIGKELVNIAVRVKSVRAETAAAAQSLLQVDKRRDMFPQSSLCASNEVLVAAAFIAGEYASLTPDPEAVIASLTHPTNVHLDPNVLAVFVQAVPKVFVRLTSAQTPPWTPARKSQVVLLAARVIHFLESLILHPSLQVQERAVEYLELMRLASEAASGHETTSEDPQDPPLLFTHAIPLLFRGVELKPMAPGALRKVPVADELDLDTSLNPELENLLASADVDHAEGFEDNNEAYAFYNDVPLPPASSAADTLAVPSPQKPVPGTRDPQNHETLARIKAQRREQYRNDPFYIGPQDSSISNSPLHQILKSSNGEDLDLDSIPVMTLDLGSEVADARPRSKSSPAKKPRASRAKIEIAADETLAGDADDDDQDDAAAAAVAAQPDSSSGSRSLTPHRARPRKALLQVDSTGLSSLSLDDTGQVDPLGAEARLREEEEMRRAMADVERLRLQMQRDAERVVGGEATVVKRKKKVKSDGAEGGTVKVKVKKTSKRRDSDADGGVGASAALENQGLVDKDKKKKKKKAKAVDTESDLAGNVFGQPVSSSEVDGGTVVVSTDAMTTDKPKRKKKRQIQFDED